MAKTITTRYHFERVPRDLTKFVQLAEKIFGQTKTDTSKDYILSLELGGYFKKNFSAKIVDSCQRTSQGGGGTLITILEQTEANDILREVRLRYNLNVKDRPQVTYEITQNGKSIEKIIKGAVKIELPRRTIQIESKKVLNAESGEIEVIPQIKRIEPEFAMVFYLDTSGKLKKLMFKDSYSFGKTDKSLYTPKSFSDIPKIFDTLEEEAYNLTN